MSAFIVFRDFLFYVCLFLVTSRGIYEKYYFNQSWEFADRSKLYKSSDKYKELEYIKLYFANKASKNFKNKVICINAGHGSPRGREYKVYCHPDASFKLISGSTKSGSQTAVSVSSGTTLSDGTPESTANLELSLCVKDYLLLNGYNVLMIREDNNCCFDI